jgi:tRNA1(Val) A37 N6-methylase TrmN6
MSCAMPEQDTTDDHFLGGRLLIRQPKRGHRAGHDAMLLAASVAAKSGQRVVEFGAGVGVAGLALAARVPRLAMTLLEIDPALAALAAHNAVSNGIDARTLAGDVADRDMLPTDAFDVVLMNPPFHDAARHRASPDADRRRAHLATGDALSLWIGAAHRVLRSGGALTMIWRADGLADVLTSLTPKYGNLRVQAVHPQPDKVATRVLIRGEKGGRAPLALHAGLILTSARVDRVLRGDGILDLADDARLTAPPDRATVGLLSTSSGSPSAAPRS